MKKLIFILSFILTYSLAFAQLTPEQIKDALGNYPEANSLEQKKDVDELFHYQQNRTNEECKAAALEESANFESLFGVKTGLLNQAEFHAAYSRINQIHVNLSSSILAAKSLYKRQRPYQYISGLIPCINKVPGYAYPSGHATMGYVYAHVLSIMYPERAELFLKRADEIGLHRVLGGVHHPSDIVAGKKLAKAFIDSQLSTRMPEITYCTSLYDDMAQRSTIAETVGIVTAVGSMGTVSIALAVSATPVILPAVGLMVVGSAVAMTSDAIQDGKIFKSIKLIKSAYWPDHRFYRSVARINDKLSELGAPEASSEKIAHLMKTKNENGHFCPIKRQRKNGKFIFVTYSVKEIEALLVKELSL